MRKNYYIVMFVLSFCSCKKEMPNTYTRTAQVDVYVAGHEFDGKNSFGIYWKNGNPVSLTDCSDASFIAVVGSDVYVAGADGGGAKYWKNGSPVTLSIGSKLGWTTSIAVSGNDVYVAGVEYIPGGNVHAVYWKNGQPTYLPENSRSVQSTDNYPISSTESIAHSIFISGSDVYVAGQETITKMISPYPSPSYITGISALYWKNGNAVYLIQGSFYGSKDDAANSVFVAGQDVYACGAWEARYWKNGTSFYLPGSSGIATTANSVFVSGSDVYVAGTQKDGKLYQTYFGQQKRYVAKCWKNGQPVNLTDGTREAYATSIAISGTDVYVAGYEEKQAGVRNWVAKYWKNGKPVILGDVSKNSTSESHSIFLAKK